MRIRRRSSRDPIMKTEALQRAKELLDLARTGDFDAAHVLVDVATYAGQESAAEDLHLALQGREYRGRERGNVIQHLSAYDRMYRISRTLNLVEQELFAKRPPSSINVLDPHGGFTAVTKPNQTLWRPGRLLKKTTEGRLLEWNAKSFYQTNDDVTRALYRVAGYRYPVALWFDNKTGQRIA